MFRKITKTKVQSLKRQAKCLEGEHPDLTHSQALDLIAQQENYPNWALLARAIVPCKEPLFSQKKPQYTINLQGTIDHTAGALETRFSANHPIAHYGKHAWIRWKVRRKIGDSTFNQTAILASPDESDLKHQMATAQRVVSFMDATDLRVSRDFRGVFGSYLYPGEFDHLCVWKDPENRYVLTSELYPTDFNINSLRTWCVNSAWAFEMMPKGCGIWNPCNASCDPGCKSHTQMLVIIPARRGGDLLAIVRAVRSQLSATFFRATGIATAVDV